MLDRIIHGQTKVNKLFPHLVKKQKKQIIPSNKIKVDNF